jgi:hypothetical protein
MNSKQNETKSVKITTSVSHRTGKPWARQSNSNGRVPCLFCIHYRKVLSSRDQCQQLLFTSSSKNISCYDRFKQECIFPSLLRLRYKSFATCISITFPYSALEYAHSIKLYIHTIPPLPPTHVSFFIISVFVLRVSFREWIHRHNGTNTGKEGLCYVLAIRSQDVTEIILLLSILQLNFFCAATVCFQIGQYFTATSGVMTANSSTKYTVEIGYNVMKRTGYFVSL